MTEVGTIEITRLLTVTQAECNQINALTGQLARDVVRMVTPSLLDRIVQSPWIELWVVRDTEAGTIVGIGSVIVAPTLTYTYARIDDVVIDEAYRSMGLGTLLMQQLINRARTRSPGKGIDLTSGPDRVEANRLYRKLGFELRDTSSYRLRF